MLPFQQCSTSTYSSWCPKTTDEALPAVLGLLPPGPAWDGGKVEGTVQNSYWRAFSNLLGYTYGRLCAFVDEFYCATVKESLDQWIADYGLDDPCDPYGKNLCLKVAAEGGATCDYFVSIATLSGWVITCEDTSTIPEPIAGCFEVGCTPLGPTPTYEGWGSNLGFGQIGTCSYGEVIHHPDPAKWEFGHHFGVLCAVPGSNLGQGPDTDESCCFIVGYYDFDVPVETTVGSTYCQDESLRFVFDCPRVGVPGDFLPSLSQPTAGSLDDTRNYSSWGHSYTWKVTVDMAASQAAQSIPPAVVDDSPTSQAGCLMAGNIIFSPDGQIGGSPLCTDNTVGPTPTFVLCFLNRIKPSHTVLNVEILQP